MLQTICRVKVGLLRIQKILILGRPEPFGLTTRVFVANMATLCHMTFVLLLLLANTNGTPATESFTDVVSLSGQDIGPPSKGKKGGTKLEEIATYAELKHDPSRPLPDSFTVCSSIMTTSYWSHYTLTFFNILDNLGDRGAFFA